MFKWVSWASYVAAIVAAFLGSTAAASVSSAVTPAQQKAKINKVLRACVMKHGATRVASSMKGGTAYYPHGQGRWFWASTYTTAAGAYVLSVGNTSTGLTHAEKVGLNRCTDSIK